MKKCTRCLQQKSLDDFRNRGDHKHLKKSRCKICESEVTSLKRKKDPEKAKLQDKKNREKLTIEQRREKYNLYNKKRYKKDPNFYKRWYWENENKRLRKLEVSKKWRLKNHDKIAAQAKKQRLTNSEHTRSRDKLKRAVRMGYMTRPKECSKCGIAANRIEGHHEDYTKPLEVIWVCIPCHKKIHLKYEV